MSPIYEEVNAPEDFICPISLAVMKDPVMSKDGKNFEKTAILDWLNRGNVNCPLTRQPLKPSLLIPNVNLRMSIRRWQKEQGILCEDDDKSISGETNRGFVGLLHFEQHHDFSMDKNPANSVFSLTSSITTTRSSTRENIDTIVSEELQDLLDLYNEVLESTSAPLDAAMPEPRGTPLSSRTAEQDTLHSIVANSRRRAWRPKLFSKKNRILS